LVLLISFFSGKGGQPVDNNFSDRFPSILPKLELKERKDKILLAIIQHESKGNVNAYNKVEDAVGLLQIRKIYVDECNRILGKKVYSYQDRKDPKKSIEMFYVIMDYRAPDYNLDKVSMVHNAG
jgi:hypothetical protein